MRTSTDYPDSYRPRSMKWLWAMLAFAVAILVFTGRYTYFVYTTLSDNSKLLQDYVYWLTREPDQHPFTNLYADGDLPRAVSTQITAIINDLERNEEQITPPVIPQDVNSVLFDTVKNNSDALPCYFIYNSNIEYAGIPIFSTPANTLLNHEDSLIFGRFASMVKRRFVEKMQRHAGDSGYLAPFEYGYELARLLGFYDKEPGMGKYNIGDSSIYIPWIYLSKENGVQITFPGTDMTRNTNYDPRNRPWYRMNYKEKNKLSYISLKGGSSGVLTSAYVDIASGNVFMVKTLLFEVIPGRRPSTEKYLLAIDLYLKPPDLKARSVYGVFQDQKVIWETLNVFSEKPVLTIILVLTWVLFLFYITGLYRPVSSEEVRLALRWSAYAGAANNVITFTSKDTDAKRIENAMGIAISRLFYFFSFSWLKRRSLTKEDDSAEKREFHLDDSRADSEIRGIQIWQVSRTRAVQRKLLGIPFVNIGTYDKFDIFVRYRGSEWPEVKLVFQKNGTDYVPERIQEAVLASILRFDPKKPLILNLEKVPILLKKSSFFKEIISGRRAPLLGRFYFDDGIKLFNDIYQNTTVRSVVRDIYLSHLLTQKPPHFLTAGDKISRVIVYESEISWQEWKRNNRENLRNLIDAYESGGAGRLYVSNVKELPEAYHDVTDKDFALLGDDLVVVTEGVYEVRERTFGSSIPTSEFRVSGYASWREADIAYYRILFNMLVKREIRNINDL